MFERFKSRPSDADGTTTTNGGNGRAAVAERPARERTGTTGATTAGGGGTAVDDRPGTARREPAAGGAPGGVATREHLQTARARQRAEYGGINWGAAFFGWLVAVGLGSLLLAIVAAAGAAVGLTTNPTTSDATSNADTIGIGGAIALLVILMIAYYCGGYVAGRMSRFDGARQGLGAWVFGILVTIALTIVALVLGDQYNVLSQLNLPSLPVGKSTMTTGAAIAGIVVLAATLLAAIAGGKAGERYHRKVDRVGFVD